MQLEPEQKIDLLLNTLNHLWKVQEDTSGPVYALCRVRCIELMEELLFLVRFLGVDKLSVSNRLESSEQRRYFTEPHRGHL